MASNASNIGSMSGEWKACDVLIAMAGTSRCRSASTRAATAVALPETTIRSGAFTAATARSPRPVGQAR